MSIAFVKKVFKDIFTEDDGVSYCWAKVMGAGVIVAYMANETYAIHLSGKLDIKDFGIGLAAVVSSVAAMIAAKQATQASQTSEGN